MNADKQVVNETTSSIIACAFQVANGLGCGFVEKVYENALAHELRKKGVSVLQQHNLTVTYDGVEVGEFATDLLVEGSVLVELKAAKALDDVHVAQCLNYLKASGLSICLLINFGNPRIEVRRLVRDF